MGDYDNAAESFKALYTSGGEYTQYRYRKKYEKHIYFRWSAWSEFFDQRPSRNSDRDIEDRTVYRYKEK